MYTMNSLCLAATVGGVVCLMTGSFGCTIKGTLETTTDGTTEVISSTTGKSWWTEDGLGEPGKQAQAFVFHNYESLLQDMAHGQGEYLQAFGAILGIPPSQKHFFSLVVQANYPVLSAIPVLQGEIYVTRFIARVRQGWSQFNPAYL